MDANANVLMQQQQHIMHYGTHPMGRGPPGRPSPLGGGGGGGGGQRHQQRPPPQKQPSSPGVIFHPALFGSNVGPRPQQQRPVPNLRPRQPPPPHQEALMYGGRIALPPPGGGRGGGGGGGGGHGGPGPPPNQHDPFLEEQVEILHEKMEGLEGELRYAWRALDVLSQEYVKMWQRLEKMEGLLSEQQTVITQLIDLYSVESSDTAPENGKSGGNSPTSPPDGDGVLVSLRHQAVPDENFYKALNAVHGDANTDMRLGDDRSQDDEDEDSAAGGKIIFPPGQSPKLRGKGNYISTFESSGSKKRKIKNGQRRGSQGDSDDAKSVSSTISLVRSEGVGEFPLPSDLSPAGYENMTPPSKPPSPPKKSAVSETKKKKSKKNNEPQNIIDEMVPPIGPLQLIGGRYSFSLMDANGDGPLLFRGGNVLQPDQHQGGDIPLRAQQVANGKPLFPSLQTAMVTPKEATDVRTDGRPAPSQKDTSRKGSKSNNNGKTKEEVKEKKEKKKNRKESKEREKESLSTPVKKQQAKVELIKKSDKKICSNFWELGFIFFKFKV